MERERNLMNIVPRQEVDQALFQLRHQIGMDKVVGAIQVTDEDEMMLISDKGTLVRARAADVSIIGRNTQGVTLINIADDEALVSVAKIAETDDDEESTEEVEINSEE
jgi:DNA gyrase subunit A